MLLIPDRTELWVSCGNTLRILCTQDLLLDPTVITVAPSDNQLVQGLVCKGDQVWCYIQDSFQVIQYNARTWIWVDSMQCGHMTQSKGECLSSPVTAEHPLQQRKVGFEDNGSNSKPEEQEEGLQDVNSTSVDVEAEEGGLTFHDDHFKKPSSVKNFQKRERASMPAGVRSRNQSGGLRRRSRPFSDSSIPSSSVRMFAKVTSLLVVKETLWIGRDTGDIIITNIDKDSPYDYSFGEVIAVLSVQSFLNWSQGPISQLLPVGSNRVVARRDISGPDRQLTHQLLVWENWGCKEVREFEEVHFGLNRAKREESLLTSPANSVEIEI